MSQIFYANLAETTLLADVSASSNGLTLMTGSGVKFPVCAFDGYYYIVVFKKGLLNEYNHEVMKVTSHAANSDFLSVERGQDGTQALTFQRGDFVQLRMTRANYNQFPIGRPNLFYNGDFTADSLQGVSAPTVAFPCWYTNVPNSAITRTVVDPIIQTGYGISCKHTLSFDIGGASTPYVLLSQKVPRHLVVGKKVTLSFYANTFITSSTKLLNVDWVTSGITPALDGVDQVVTITADLKRFAVTFDLGNIGFTEVDPYVIFRIYDAQDFKNFGLNVLGVKLEVCEQATEFTDHSYSENLAEASRHCRVLGKGDSGFWTSPSTCEFNFKTGMRSVPTVTKAANSLSILDVGVGFKTAVATLTLLQNDKNQTRVVFGGFTGATANHGAMSDEPLLVAVAN